MGAMGCSPHWRCHKSAQERHTTLNPGLKPAGRMGSVAGAQSLLTGRTGSATKGPRLIQRKSLNLLRGAGGMYRAMKRAKRKSSSTGCFKSSTARPSAFCAPSGQNRAVSRGFFRSADKAIRAPSGCGFDALCSDLTASAGLRPDRQVPLPTSPPSSRRQER